MEIIKSNAEISLVFKKGQRINAKDFTLIALRNEKQHGQGGRAAFVASKKLGNAVWRNRAKRRMRAVCRELGGPKSGYDLVFIAKRSTNEADFKRLLSTTANKLSLLN